VASALAIVHQRRSAVCPKADTRVAASSVPLLTEGSQIGANLRVCVDEEDRADFDQRG
jgi:hypothetical protein